MRQVAKHVAVLLVALAAVGEPAGARVRDDVRMNRPVYLIHGYDAGGEGVDCRARWRPAIDRWRAAGWTGAFHAIGYYTADHDGCDRVDPGGSRDTSVGELGRLLAWKIYREHSRKQQPVDIVAHSMGGLIARMAIAGTQHHVTQGGRRFPPRLYVEDVVTLGTPHAGVSGAWRTDCLTVQCRQMRQRSPFLVWLGRFRHPHGAGGTDWSLIASQSDAVVPVASALDSQGVIGAGHDIVYAAGQGVTHSALPSLWSHDRHYRLDYWNWWHRQGGFESMGKPHWRHTTRGRSPVYAAGGGIKHTPMW